MHLFSADFHERCIYLFNSPIGREQTARSSRRCLLAVFVAMPLSAMGFPAFVTAVAFMAVALEVGIAAESAFRKSGDRIIRIARRKKIFRSRPQKIPTPRRAEDHSAEVNRGGFAGIQRSPHDAEGFHENSRCIRPSAVRRRTPDFQSGMPGPRNVLRQFPREPLGHRTPGFAAGDDADPSPVRIEHRGKGDVAAEKFCGDRRLRRKNLSPDIAAENHLPAALSVTSGQHSGQATP